MFGLILGHEKMCSLSLDERNAYAEIHIVALIEMPEAKEPCENCYDEATKERMRKRLNAVIARLEREKILTHRKNELLCEVRFFSSFCFWI